MSVFHSLKSSNTNLDETKRLAEFNEFSQRDFTDYVEIFLPKLVIEKFEAEKKDVSYDGVLSLSLSDIQVHDWLSLLSLKPTEPAGVLIVRVIDTLLSSKVAFGYEDIYDMIQKEQAEVHVKNSLINLFKMIEKLKIFEKQGTPFENIVSGGKISVLDISYLGRIGGFDVRNLILGIIGRRLLSERTLYTTLEMQAEANLVSKNANKNNENEHPLVYMIIDEAHLFLPAKQKTLSSDVLIDWIKLGRHPGLSLIMATQEPSALHETAFRQADIILAHNVTANDDITALGRAKQSFMTGNKDIQKIVSTMESKKGLCVLFDDKTRKIEMVCIRPRMSLHAGMDASALKKKDIQGDFKP
jgi:hypothetical protein